VQKIEHEQSEQIRVLSILGIVLGAKHPDGVAGFPEQ